LENLDYKTPEYMLTIESSGTVAGVSVFHHDRVIATKIIDNGLTHSQKLMLCVDEVVKEAQISKQQLKAIAVSNGPGSFTGLRIGVTTAKTIAQALNIPVIPVNTLDAMACNALLFNGIICPMIDARREQVFTAIYSKGDQGDQMLLERRSEYLALPVTELVPQLLKQQQFIVCVGDGAIAYHEQLQKMLADKLIRIPKAQVYPSPVNIGIMALNAWEKGEAMTADVVVPYYLRKSQAEQKREQANGAVE
jgi:tRNA threonylcarbamoyladenosine biosynthesis protein TsaB